MIAFNVKSVICYLFILRRKETLLDKNIGAII